MFLVTLKTGRSTVSEMSLLPINSAFARKFYAFPILAGRAYNAMRSQDGETQPLIPVHRCFVSLLSAKFTNQIAEFGTPTFSLALAFVGRSTHNGWVGQETDMRSAGGQANGL